MTAVIGAPTSMGAHAPRPRAGAGGTARGRRRRRSRRPRRHHAAALGADREHRRAQNADGVAQAAREVAVRVEGALAPADVVVLAADPGETRPAEQRAMADHGIRAVPIAEVAADPAVAARRELELLDHEHLLVHFDVDVVDFVDLPLSENTGLNIGLELATACAALETLAGDARAGALTVTEHNPLHGAPDGSTTAALAAALRRALE